jgi:hypothetical protein
MGSRAQLEAALYYCRDGDTLLVTKLDRLARSARQFDAIARGVAEDMGGEDQLSTVQKHLCEAFAGVALQVNDCNARLLLGERVDIIEHSAACAILVRIASRLGIKRVARNISIIPPTADEYFAYRARQKEQVGEEDAA